MKTLQNILPKQGSFEVRGNYDLEISGLAIDSRLVLPGYLFVALEGSEVDGHEFIQKAIENGAIAILGKKDFSYPERITVITSSEITKVFGEMASNFYNNPSNKLELIGVTGTNGKTTIATLLYQLCREFGYKCGLIATTGIWIDNQKIEATHTTPDVITINQLLARMLAADCEFVFMEVSSHAIVQGRIAGLQFKGAIFTNLTHDHLDYHVTFENYRDAKKLFFDGLDLDAFAITNADDKNGKYMLQNTKAVRLTYGLQNIADYKARLLEYDLHGMQIEFDGEELFTQITGKFNAYNLLAVYAAACMLDFPKEQILTAISNLKPVEGRLSAVMGPNNVTGIVDYAHTPDALLNILQSIHEINTANGRVITVVGCGGNRDKTKRPIMAKIASENSDEVILTSDNPRYEDPETILKEMEAGIPFAKKRSTLVIAERGQAIKVACTLAKSGDVILVAGKGHEKYQEIKGVRYPFDDRKILSETLMEVLS